MERKRGSRGPVATLICLLLVVAVWQFLACSQEETPIRIGFAGCLSGKLSDLGTDGRDGVLLAVEEANAAGGVQGRPVELLIKDDAHDQKTALACDQELVDAGVVAVIGHMTSSMTMAARPLLEKNGVFMISPTASSDKLTGIDDNFFRVTGPALTQAEHLADYAGKHKGYRTVAVIYDLANKAYTESLFYGFKQQYRNLNGRIDPVVTFSSKENPSYGALIDRALQSGPDCIFLLAGSVDTAMMCQQLAKKEVTIPVISSAWAKTVELIQNGGRSVEGVVFSQSYNPENQTAAFTAFVKRFEARFGRKPDFGAAFAHEAARVLITALGRTADAGEIKKEILAIRIFDGLQSPIQFDEFGDTRRKRFLYSVQNGDYHLMEGS